MSELKRRRPRRSNGCEPCRTGRQRCSEIKPTCLECTKRDIACIYKTSNIIFQSENAFVEQSFHKDRSRRVRSTQSSDIPPQDTRKLKDSDTRLSPTKWQRLDESEASYARISPRSHPSRNSAIGTISRSDEVPLCKFDIAKTSPSSSSTCGEISDESVLITNLKPDCDQGGPGNALGTPGQYGAASSQPSFRKPNSGTGRILHDFARQGPSLHLISDQESRALAVFFKDFLPSEIVLSNHREWIGILKTGLQGDFMLRNLVLAIARINIGSSYSDFPSRRENLVLALEHYSLALHGLQTSLYDKHEALRDDVLVAVNLLGVFEMVKGSSVSSLHQHLQGGLSLIQARGPAAHGQPNLLSQIASGFQNNSIRCALESRTKTFFAEPEWIEAARSWRPIGTNRWCGTELNAILLRLTNVNATDGFDMAEATLLHDDIIRTRSNWLDAGTPVTNSLLESRSPKAGAIGLARSPLGPTSLCFDRQPGTYRLTLASITFDWALLTIYLGYPSLMTDREKGHSIMVRLVHALQ